MNTHSKTPRLTKAEAAGFLAPLVGTDSLSEVTLDRWRRERQLPYLKLAGRVTFDPEELRQWVESKKQNRQPQPIGVARS